ncbi:hypothetical protein [Tsukamurella paurometabola]|uniref:Uncharacterized protein n=2 Tax=Tsukamurella paurometabola TaxID=2061 RepID=A0A3P8L5T8_TSUPA|nr:hypothetical protein [Tsukamurella paurometabola]UEA84006.1 hypothetical protein LK411_03980 [Tsukamurella paurometabola]VDR41165.1 Uncharacterised protein [Tsukamurella paurometabola]
MRPGGLLAGATVAVLASVGLPAVAQASPVVPAQAVLAAHEFPAGSKDYKAFPIGRLPAARPQTARTPCDARAAELDAAVAGASAIEVEAWRGDTLFTASIIDRPVAAQFEAATLACTKAGPKIAPPADLARVNPTVRRSNSQRMEAMVDVRGVNVGVVASSPRGKTLDADTFWQVLRAQVAKVERQP